MNEKQTSYKLQYAIIILVIFLPLLTWKLHADKSFKPKKENTYPQTEFTWHSWFNEWFQFTNEKYIAQNFGGRNLLLKIHNQVLYSFFKATHAPEVVIGKQDYFYLDKYILSYLGRRYNGKTAINTHVKRIALLQRLLAERNIKFLMIIAPCKAYYHPEFIPDNYLTYKKPETLYEDYLAAFKKNKVRCIDFNRWFMQQKETTAEPLFQRYGAHWTPYGAYLALDSLLSYMREDIKQKTPEIKFKGFTPVPAEINPDVDLLEQVNVFYPVLPAYGRIPNLSIHSKAKFRPSILVVGDSYFWNMLNLDPYRKIFDKPQFWFYNREFHPALPPNQLPVGKFLAQTISKQEYIILLASPSNFNEMGWGFIEQACWQMIKNPKSVEKHELKDKALLEMMRYIRSDKKWMKDIRTKAAERKISADSMLLLDARWGLENFEEEE